MLRKILSGTFAVFALVFAAPVLANAESVELSTSANPTEDVPMTIKASGIANGTDKLFVYVDSLGRPCESDASASYGNYMTESGGESLSAGSFSKEYAYTPDYIGGGPSTYSVCGYLATSEFTSPDATSEHRFVVQLPSASVSFSVTPNPVTQGQSVKITASGATEAARTLYVYVDNLGRSCEGTPYASYGDYLTGSSGEALAAGTYAKEYTYTPNYFGLSEGHYSLCGYIAPELYASPDATGADGFTVLSLAGIAEKEQHAAEELASRKAEEERQAKARYEAEAPAREAAERAAVIAAARSMPVSRLIVKTVSHRGRTSKDPGYTELVVSTSHYAYVSVKLVRYGHSTEDFEWGDVSTEVAETIPWSCESPGGTYGYVVTARTNVAPAFTTRGHFSPVSVERCRTLKREEAESREQSERRAAEERRRGEREERERLETYEANCRTEGGTPITLIVEGRPLRYCRAPQGGLLPVPH